MGFLTDYFVILFYQMALHVAAEGGKLDVVEYLVGKCPNLNIKNQFEVSVL